MFQQKDIYKHSSVQFLRGILNHDRWALQTQDHIYSVRLRSDSSQYSLSSDWFALRLLMQMQVHWEIISVLEHPLLDSHNYLYIYNLEFVV